MIRSHRLAVGLAGVLGALLLPGATTVEAQQTCRRPPGPEVHRLMVPTLRAEDKRIGVQAADELRERLEREFNCQELIIVSRNDIFNTLSVSGYDTASALNPNDAKLLGQNVRADEYISGVVRQTPEGFSADLNLVLQRDPALVQPLEPITGRRLGDIARAAATQIEAARKQIEAEEKCVAALRAGNNQEAIQHADYGITQYPRATLARLCKQAAYAQLNFPADSMLRLGNEILEIDPNSRLALQSVARAYEATNQDEKAVQAWAKLISLDPTNAGLVSQATEFLVKSGNAAAAKPIIEKAVQDSPGDPDLQELYWLVLLTIRDWEAAIPVGEELARIDTSFADTTFFIRLVTAYQADSQPQQAAEAGARGNAKFPQNATLLMLRGQNLRQIGQLQQAEQVVRQALSIDPKFQRGWLQLAQIQWELQQGDSTVSSLRQGLANGEDPNMVAQYALSLGGQLWQQANASKALPDWERLVPFLSFVDSLQTASGQPVPQTRFMLGFAGYSAAQAMLPELPKAKDCEMTRKAQQYVQLAATKVREGGSFNPEAAGQLMQWTMQALPFVDAQVKANCPS